MSGERRASPGGAPLQTGGGDDGIVGREVELARLTDFLAAGEGLVATLLEGVAGIGKTTLWRAGVEAGRYGGYRVLACRPAGAEAELSYAALGDLIAPVLGELLPALPSPQRWALQVALLMREPGGPPPDQRAIAVALLGALGALSRESPVLVAVDEAQWVDAASAGVLEFALRRLERRRVKVLAAVRTEEHRAAPLRLERVLTADQIDRVLVGPLSLGALHRLLRARLRVALPRPSLVRVHEASGGNPFYALELGRALIERERRPDASRHLSIPDSLDELLHARLARLAGPVRHLVAAASAMSDPTVSALAAATASTPGELLSNLDAATAAGIVVVEADRVRFTHPLLASSAYWHAGSAERRILHLRLAHSTAHLEERARHMALAADGPSEEVAVALDAAAQQAAARGAIVAAAELADLALGATPDSDPAGVQRRQAQLAERYFEAGDRARARHILEEILPGVSHGGARADVLLLLARTRDDTDGQAELCRAALREAGDDPIRLARVHRRLAETAARGMDQRTALEHARAAVEAAERAGDASMLASSLAYVGLFETFLGEITPGLLERAVELEERAGYLPEYESPSMVMGYRLIHQDQFEDARAWLEMADARALVQDDFTSRLTIALHLAELEIGVGRWERAAEHAAEGYALADELDSDHARCALLYVTAKAEALLGRLDSAGAAARRGIELARSSKSEIYEFNNRRVLGLVALSVEDWAAAAAWLGPLLEFESVRSRRVGFYALLPDTIEAFVGIGKLEQAGELVQLLGQTAQRLDRPYLVACASRCRGLLLASEGDLDAAIIALEEALVAHDRLPDPFERARTLLALGRIERRARRRRDARQSLEAALAVFEELGAGPWRDQARRELSRIGGRAPSTGALTPTEEQVAALVAEGRTNREAAAALYLSEHTIEGHLSRIYSKLGVRSRAELARHLATHPAQRPDSQPNP
jgi:DNA-binding CsgD family transcriptional regulator